MRKELFAQKPLLSPVPRPRRSKRRPARFRYARALFVLPNLFTLASIFCGFYAILQATLPASPAALYRASVAICFAIFFDMADGRVARMTATESEFGVQLDSLADVVSFGVAPAVLIYRWALSRLGVAGLCLGFGYIACGAIRLARYNVLAARRAPAPAHSPPKGGPSYFLGLPIPLAAGQLATAVMCSQRYSVPWPVGRLVAPALVALVSALMVSSVRYRTLKEVRPSKPMLLTLASVLVAFLLVAWKWSPAIGGLCLFAAYVAFGLVETLLQRTFKRRRLPPG